MRLGGLQAVAATVLLASGCAVAPHGPPDGSVTHDVVDYLHRQWPLTGPPVVPADACQGSCSCCCGGSAKAPVACQAGPEVWSDDWNQTGYQPHAGGYADDPPPAVPLDAPPPGRFFPAPVQPVFTPQGVSEGGFGPIAKAAG